jgi:glutaredoxin
MRGNVLNTTIHHRARSVRATLHLACVGLVCIAGFAHAQTIYRVVGPDGKVTFSDKPPVSASNVTATSAGGKPLDISGPVLPLELRQVVTKYPVTLYTSSSCAPCGTGRTLLSGRGVPFTEKTVTTNDDAQALQRISGETSLPFLTIGGQQIKGYSDAEWTQFLDAAGYPKTSVLPATYRNPAAAPLVAVQKPKAAPKGEEGQPERTPTRSSAPPVDNSSNPAGIKF